MSTTTTQPPATRSEDRTPEPVRLEGAPDAVRAAREEGVVVLRGDLPELSACGRTRDCVLRTLSGTAVADQTAVPGARPLAQPERSVAVARAVQTAITRAHVDAIVLQGPSAARTARTTDPALLDAPAVNRGGGTGR